MVKVKKQKYNGKNNNKNNKNNNKKNNRENKTNYLMKYPFVYLLREKKDKHIDKIKSNPSLDCTLEIIDPSGAASLKNMFDNNHHILVTYGATVAPFLPIIRQIVPQRFFTRWFHKTSLKNIKEFSFNVNYCYIHNAITSRETTRPIFSIFTSCYNSYKKILRAYRSLKGQTLKDWEWVILDDSPEDKHFDFLRKTFVNDKQIRLYKRDKNSGNIGNVKNETIGLCRGKYVLELDHDDEILPSCLEDATNIFDEDPDVGFVYMDFINISESGNSLSYGDFAGKGYAGYYKQKYNGRWVDVFSTPNINNITVSNLVCMPNHPRMWRRETLISLGSYSELLPICDDFEILLRTAIKTKIVKIHQLGYIQYMNDSGNNFSLIRNREINRLGPYFIQPQFYEMYKLQEKMKEADAYEDEKYIHQHSQIWKRKEYTHKYCNKIYNPHYDKQICLLDSKELDNPYVQKQYENPRVDIILLDNKNSVDTLIEKIEEKKFERMKCYSPPAKTREELMNYFLMICRHQEEYEFLPRAPPLDPASSALVIITPCSRPQNLKALMASIKLERIKEWKIVYDAEDFSPQFDNPKIKEYAYKGDGISGNDQRNYGLDQVKGNAYIYMLDDDNVVHPDFWDFLSTIKKGKIYTFDQTGNPVNPKGSGAECKVGKIDTAQFLVDRSLIKKQRWIPDDYCADGHFIEELYKKNKESHIYVPQVLAYYNFLQ